jgi:tRNA threonylcarbamoyladenosine biosynthesis protein TsaB
MNVIALDTCLGACSAAVRWLDRIEPGPPQVEHWREASRYEELATGHAERLMPMIRDILDESGRRIQDLDAIAVTEGPGTFTGIRLGVAAARALALATGLPIRATTCLHVLAYQAKHELGDEGLDHTIAVCADARNKQVFVQLFGEASDTPLTKAQLLTPEAAAALKPGVSLMCVGSAAEIVAEAARRSRRQITVRLPRLQPNARHLAVLAHALEVRKALRPLYLRAPDAKPPRDMSLSRVE